jgi:hypothetical protein
MNAMSFIDTKSLKYVKEACFNPASVQGPLLQAQSHYWVNKLKPFFDAFYGTYTSRYPYWPGVLPLAR